MEKSSGVYSFDIFFLSREEDGGRVVTQLVLGYVNTHTHNCFYWLAIQPKKYIQSCTVYACTCTLTCMHKTVKESVK